jgi:hypothetical protein
VLVRRFKLAGETGYTPERVLLGDDRRRYLRQR